MQSSLRAVVLLVMLCLGTGLRGEVPAGFGGDWLLVNGVVVLSIREDGTMTLRNSGATGVLTIGETGDFVWNLAAAADQHFLEEGVRTVTFGQIVGPDKYIKKLQSVDGEDYQSLDLSASAKTWTITSESGIKVTYER